MKSCTRTNVQVPMYHYHMRAGENLFGLVTLVSLTTYSESPSEFGLMNGSERLDFCLGIVRDFLRLKFRGDSVPWLLSVVFRLSSSSFLPLGLFLYTVGLA